MNESIEALKEMMDRVILESYKEGYSDATIYYASQEFSPARTEALTGTVKLLQKENKDFRKKLALATKLIKFAQMTSCGSNGQFDRFFEEKYYYYEDDPLVANEQQGG